MIAIYGSKCFSLYVNAKRIARENVAIMYQEMGLDSEQAPHVVQYLQNRYHNPEVEKQRTTDAVQEYRCLVFKGAAGVMEFTLYMSGISLLIGFGIANYLQ